MIKYNLICKCGESFESWFISSSGFDIFVQKETHKMYLLRIFIRKEISYGSQLA